MTRSVATASIPAANARGAAAIAGALAEGGPIDVVLSPGLRSAPLALAFDALCDARLHVVLDERAAGFVALGMGRARRRPAVLVCTSGSAGAHYLPAICEASAAGVPLVAVTADRPPEMRHTGALQTMDQRGLYGPHVRFAAELPAPTADLEPGRIRALCAQALAHARSGPVHLDAPFREPLWEPGAEASISEIRPAGVLAGARRLDCRAVHELAGALAAHRRGLILCGPLAPASLDAEAFAAAVTTLARVLGWPVVADPTSGLRFGVHDRSQIVTTADAVLRGEPNELAPSCVLRFGLTPTSKVVDAFATRHAADTLLVDADGVWHDPSCNAGALVVADPIGSCHDLACALHRRGIERDGAWLRSWQRAERVARRTLARHARVGSWEARIARAVVAALPDAAQLHVASSMPIRDVDAFGGTARRRIAVHCNRGLSGIDGTVATVLGEALGRAVPTAAIVGDLAMLHDLGGLETAASLGASATLVVPRNGGGGIFEMLPIAAHRACERLFVTPRAGDLGGVCRALGVRHARVEAGELGRAVRADLAAGGVGVIEVPIDRNENVARHARAWTAVTEALGGNR
jgi:2-succinyl-5-enolpyruvyl-6-hydroxy-3-cyclohexene-1-carboxylate synthase